MKVISINDEKKLVEKIIKRDEKSLLFLYRTHHKQIFNFIKRRIGETEVAEEITQDVFLDFIEGLRDFHFQCSLKTFLFSIAKNKTIDVIRKKKIKKILFSALPKYLIESVTTVVFDEEMEKNEIKRKINKTLTSLPNDYRLILRLKYIEDQTVKKISKKLMLGFKATESLLFRARKAFTKVFNNLS